MLRPLPTEKGTGTDYRGGINRMGCMDRIMLSNDLITNSNRVMLISSRSNLGAIHKLEYMPITNTIVCDCKGFEYTGRCWHVDVFTPMLPSLKEANQR